MLVAIFAPLLDGGIQQITQVYRGLTSQARTFDGTRPDKQAEHVGASSSQSGGSLSDSIQAKERSGGTA